MSASLLVNGEQQFVDGNGVPYAGGSVYFYVPNTTTLKNTWQDPGEVSLNTNPVVLDGNGRAVIWGDGNYRQVLYDVNNNLIWDKLTYSFVTALDVVTSFDGRTGAVSLAQSDVLSALGVDAVDNSVLSFMPSMTIKGNNGGSAGAPQDLTAAQVAAMIGTQVSNYYSADTGSVNTMAASLASAPTSYTAGLFLFVNVAFTNTGPATLNVQGIGAEAVQFQGAALAANMLVAGRVYLFCFDGTQFEVLSPVSTTAGNWTQSLATNGWAKASNGLTFQWMTATVNASGSTLVTWPVSFAAACTFASCTNLDESGSPGTQNNPAQFSTISAASGLVLNAGNGTSAFIFAIGY